MVDVCFVSYNPHIHKKDFRQLNIETVTYHWYQLWGKHQIDVEELIGKTPEEYVDDRLESYETLKPPDGVLYILEVDGNAAGMGAVHRLRDGVGEIKLMYNRPEYRGRGYAQMLLDRLLEAGRGLGFSSFLLEVAGFAEAAQHVYKKAGFKERDPYPETEITSLKPYWVWMEKKED